MKRFYLCNGNIPKGPFRVDELIQYGVKETDLIWCEGFLNCKLAVDISELRNLFKAAPRTKKPAVTRKPYNINEDLEVIYPGKNINAKYITLLGWSAFAVMGLFVYYCVTQFM